MRWASCISVRKPGRMSSRGVPMPGKSRRLSVLVSITSKSRSSAASLPRDIHCQMRLKSAHAVRSGNAGDVSARWSSALCFRHDRLHDKRVGDTADLATLLCRQQLFGAKSTTLVPKPHRSAHHFACRRIFASSDCGLDRLCHRFWDNTRHSRTHLHVPRSVLVEIVERCRQTE